MGKIKDISKAKSISNTTDVFMEAMYYGIFKDLETQLDELKGNYMVVLGRHLYLYMKRYHKEFLYNHKYILNVTYNITESEEVKDGDFLLLKEG